MFVRIYRDLLKVKDRALTRLLALSFKHVGRKTHIQFPCRIVGEANISIGTDVFIGRNAWLSARSLLPEYPVPILKIDDHCSLSGNCTITSARSVIIEKGVLIAKNVHISDHSHAFSDTRSFILNQGIDRILPVKIESGAWIGHGAVIMPGVTIGRNSVVGANSVVTKSVPPFTIFAGIPARLIRKIST